MIHECLIPRAPVWSAKLLWVKISKHGESFLHYIIIMYKQGGLLHLPPAAPDSPIFHHIITCIHAIEIIKNRFCKHEELGRSSMVKPLKGERIKGIDYVH